MYRLWYNRQSKDLPATEMAGVECHVPVGIGELMQGRRNNDKAVIGLL
jgi:hypothetical protein